MIDGAVSWLNTDLRVFQICPGVALIGLGGVSMGSSASDASTFIKGVISGFNGRGPFNHPFDLSRPTRTPPNSNSARRSATCVCSTSPCAGSGSASSRRERRMSGFSPPVPSLHHEHQRRPDDDLPFRRVGRHQDPAARGHRRGAGDYPVLRRTADRHGRREHEHPAGPSERTDVHGGEHRQRAGLLLGCWLDINQPGQLVCPSNPPNATGPFTAGGRASSNSCAIRTSAWSPKSPTIRIRFRPQRRPGLRTSWPGATSP